MNNGYPIEDERDKDGVIGHLLLILFAFCLVLFNEISGYSFQDFLYSYGFVFFFVFFFVSIQHYILYMSHVRGVSFETGESTRPVPLSSIKQYRLSSLVYRIEPQTACLVLLVGWVLQIYLLRKPTPDPMPLPEYPELFSVISALLSITAFVFFRYLDSVSKRAACKELSAILPFLAASIIFAAANAIGIILSKYGFSWAFPVLRGFVITCNFIVLFEYSTNTVINFYTERRYPFDTTPLYNTLILSKILLPGRKELSFADMVENRFGIKIHDIWIIGFLRKSFFPLLACQVLLLWSLTCFAIINPEENGIRERLGKQISFTPLTPGLHHKLPAPFEKIIKFKTKEVKTITIGYEGDRSIRNLFWSTAHFEKAFNFCLGEGRELITVNVDIHYLIDNIFDYHYLHSDPVGELNNIGYEAFTEKTVHGNIQEVLSLDRNEFLADIRIEMERKIALSRLGIDIIDISLNEIHPPSEVANTYQSVISSKIKAVTLKLNAERDVVRKMLGFTKEAKSEINKANIYHSGRIAASTGEVSSYMEKFQAYRIAPGLYKKRLYLDTIEEKWQSSEITIVDHTLQSENKQELWLYLDGEPMSNE